MEADWKVVPIINVREPTWSVMKDGIQFGVITYEKDNVMTITMVNGERSNFMKWLCGLMEQHGNTA